MYIEIGEIVIDMMQKHVEISSKNFTKQNPLGLNINPRNSANS